MATLVGLRGGQLAFAGERNEERNEDAYVKKLVLRMALLKVRKDSRI